MSIIIFKYCFADAHVLSLFFVVHKYNCNLQHGGTGVGIVACIRQSINVISEFNS